MDIRSLSASVTPSWPKWKPFGCNTDDSSGDGNDVDLFSTIVADDESDYGLDNHDIQWLVFGARGSLVNAPPEFVPEANAHLKQHKHR
jgi:hypothetical protein